MMELAERVKVSTKDVRPLYTPFVNTLAECGALRAPSNAALEPLVRLLLISIIINQFCIIGQLVDMYLGMDGGGPAFCHSSGCIYDTMLPRLLAPS